MLKGDLLIPSTVCAASGQYSPNKLALSDQVQKQKVLTVLPIGLVFFMTKSAGDFMEPIFTTLTGRVVASPVHGKSGGHQFQFLYNKRIRVIILLLHIPKCYKKRPLHGISCTHRRGQTKTEIDTMVASQKMEQKVLTVLPIGLVFFMTKSAVFPASNNLLPPHLRVFKPKKCKKRRKNQISVKHIADQE
mgnify:CR=1 FL=1